MMNSPGSLKLHRFFLAATLLLVCQPAFAEKRVALVLGNSAYQNVAPLPNPVNDGAVIAATLKQAGFDVVDSRQNLPAAETRRALRDFADLARDADIAVVYYAGHGMEVDGTNYLIPVDAKLERDTDVYDEAFSLDRVLLAVEPAKQLRLVILDACRDNPFAKSMRRTVASRAIGRGLAKIEPTSPNTLIAYSAKAGSTALDGDAKNSPFTLALAKHLTTPGLDVRKAFGFVRDDVLKTTGNRQEPFVYGSLGGDDVPLVPARPALSSSTPAPSPQAEARRDYELALQIGNKDALNAFLAQYPDGYLRQPRAGFSSPSSPPRKRALPRPKRRGRPKRSARGLPPRARKRRSRRRRKPTPRPPNRPVSRPKKPRRSRRSRPPRPSASVSQPIRPRPARLPKTMWPPAMRGGMNLASLSTGAATGRTDKIGADRVAPRRLSHRRNRRRMERGVAAFAGAVQRARGNQIRRQAGKPRCARCDQAEAGAGLSADLRARLQGGRRPLQQDRLRGRLLPQRRQ